MSTHIAFPRAVNVGGNQQIAMSALRGLLETLGFARVRSVLQSGNLLFDGDGQTGGELERLLEVETEATLGLRVYYVVRTADELEIAIARNPLSEQARRDPSHLLVAFLKSAPHGADVDALRAAVKGPETLDVIGNNGYLYYPAGIGRSKLTNKLIEEKLRCRATARNWNTVRKLHALTQV